MMKLIAECSYQNVYTLAFDNLTAFGAVVENTTKIRQNFSSDDIRLMREALFQVLCCFFLTF